MKKDRLSKWDGKENKFRLLFDHPMDPLFKEFLEKRESSGNYPKDDDKFSDFRLMQVAKELIFDIENDKPIFYVICPIMSTKSFEITYENALKLFFEGREDTIEKEVINTIGLAVAFELPIYPNSKKVENQLSNYYQKLIKNGFTAPDGKGNDVRLIPINSKNIQDFKLDNFTKTDLTKFWSAGDLLLLKYAVIGELSKLNNAQKILAYLELAINELEKLLNSTKRNENQLQECLTKYPILFGFEYSRIIPKHRLGSEYEADYALERYDGLIDLMEIESSTLPLFTKRNNPSSKLVHAEQQVIDWLDWIEKNNSYAKLNLKGLLTPKGYVVIGRDSDLNDKSKASLIRRNKLFNGYITILTYDNLLEKAKTIRNILSSKNN